MLKRLTCMLLGHKLTLKPVCNTGYAQITLQTCDRCALGSVDLEQAKAIAAAVGIAVVYD